MIGLLRVLGVTLVVTLEEGVGPHHELARTGHVRIVVRWRTRLASDALVEIHGIEPVELAER